MGCVNSSDYELGQPVTVRGGWGDRLFQGIVANRPSPYSLTVTDHAGRAFMVSTSAIGVGKMSAERPWADAPREMLEQQLVRMAAELAKRPTLQDLADADYNGHLATEALRVEVEGLTEVIAMQMEAIAPVAPVKAEDTEWYERLVDHLETYLVRTVGSRNPLRIDDVDLRALVQHIRE